MYDKGNYAKHNYKETDTSNNRKLLDEGGTDKCPTH